MKVDNWKLDGPKVILYIRARNCEELIIILTYFDICGPAYVTDGYAGEAFVSFFPSGPHMSSLTYVT